MLAIRPINFGAAALLVAGLWFICPPNVAPANAAAPSYEASCADAKPGHFRCFALHRTDVAPLAAPSAGGGTALPDGATPYGFGPADLASAYNLPGGTAGDGMLVAIVDAYDDPTAESDLAVYRSQYGLPACTTANGCFHKVDQNGGTSYPSANSGWAGEISLDLDMVSATCPACHILLVEAKTSSYVDLGTAVNRAVAMGAVAVSNSYGGPESSSNSYYDAQYFDHPGVAITASTGDCGYRCDGFESTGVAYPAASQYVVAVGGTRLARASNSRGWTETAWGNATSKYGAGSGCSAYETKPEWQSDASCARRMQADVSAVADPSTGVAVYYSGEGGWSMYGGTSASSPIVASIYAMATSAPSDVYPAMYLYQHPGYLNDVQSGSNDVWRTCTISYYCTAGAGYDGPTGLGTPNGVTAFGPGATTLPGKPLNVTATSNTSGGATVSWEAPAGGGHPTSHTATSSPGGKKCQVSGMMTCNVTGLTNGQAYTFTVAATNPAGTGPASDASNSVTPRPRPGAPSNALAGLNGASAVVSWDAAANNGSAITSYTVTSSPDGLTCSWTSGPLVCTVAGLRSMVSYTFTVAATNSWGTGPSSAPSNSVVRTSWSVDLDADATQVSVGTTVTLTATASSDVSPTEYWISILDQANSVMTVCGDGTQCVLTMRSVSAATITFHAVVGDRNGGSAVASSAGVRVDWTTPGAPGRPTDVVAIPGDASAAVSWSAPVDDGGSDISAYVVTSSPDALQCSWSSGPLGCVVTGLTNGQAYTFTVKATNSSGIGPASDPSEAVTPQKPPASTTYYPISPARVLDTRPDNGNIENVGLKGRFVAGQVRTFGVAGVKFAGGGDAIAVPADAVAVTGNVTISSQTAAGLVAVGPAVEANGSTSTVNFVAKENRANNVTVLLGEGGKLSAVYRSGTAGATTDLIFDVTGYFLADESGVTYNPVAPGRVLDTRSGSGHIGLSGKFRNGLVRTIAVVGVKGIGWASAQVPSAATAVTANVTVTNATADGFVSVGPKMTTLPKFSTLNTKKGRNTANGMTVALNAGQLQAIWIGAAGSSADLVIDVTGYLTTDTSGLHFFALNPYRVLDSGTGLGASGKFIHGKSKTLTIGTGNVPADAQGIAGNLTLIAPSSGGYAFIAPTIVGTPTSSTVNADARINVANGFDVSLDDAGEVSLVWYGASGSTTNMQLDIGGYWK